MQPVKRAWGQRHLYSPTVTPGSVSVEQVADVSVVCLHGEHDLSTAAAVGTELDRALARSGKVIVDFSQATFIDSSIVGVLYTASQAGEPTAFAVVAPPGAPPRRLFDLLGMAETILTFDSREAAVRYTPSGSSEG
jgi:anti-anti-sigma factor